MHLTFTIEKDTATPRARSLKEIATGPGALRAGGIGLRKVVRQHLRDLPPNKAGFPTTGFYKSAAESVTAPEVDGKSVSISITQIGMRQRYFGGDINPINAKFLTVAANAASYGKRAGEFGGLKFAFAQDENGELHPALVTTEAFQERGSKRNRRGDPPKSPFGPDTVMFWLYRHVHQEADPGVLPTGEELNTGFMLGLRSYVRARLHDPTADVSFTSGGANSSSSPETDS